MKSPHLPSFSRFAELARDHDLVPLYRRLLSDSLTPVSAFRLLDDGESSACLFESVIGGEKVGRYSFIALHPNSPHRGAGAGSAVGAAGQ
ncbi:MAG: hypothetical protein KatS3mg111_0953 [Pirellulaceae bacterium]|nr:MAG: hypothetical protein KatS3mg111_0953 [Pirellulaceae bacterium]